MDSDGRRPSRSPAPLVCGIVAVALAASACAGAGGAAATSTTSAEAIATVATTATTRTPALSSTTSASGPTTTTGTPPRPAYPEPTEGAVDRWVPEVLATAPHDTAAFTQGLAVRGEILYESTGRYGESTVRIVDRADGQVRLITSLEPVLFGEGLDLIDDRLIQITWRERTAIVWDAATLEEVDRYGYEGEGWGLCYDGDRLIMSDGSADLTFRDSGSFAPTGVVTVTLHGAPVTRLNELECVGGLVFANVWLTTDIVVIEPESGFVTAVIDAAALDTIGDATGGAVLNGIAYDAAAEVFLVTGKLWPTMYEVRFVAK